MKVINNKYLLTLKQIGSSAFRQSLFFKEFILFATSSVLFHSSRFVVSLIAARLLGPATWGFWSLLSIILMYSCLSHLGVINAMNRDVPLFKGKGDSERVGVIRRVSLGYISISVLLVGGLMMIATLFIKNTAFRTPLQFIVILFLTTQFYSYLEVFLKSDGRFNQMSYQQFIFAGIFPLITIPLVRRFGLPGFILGQSVAMLAISLFIARIIPFDFKPKIDTREIIRLIKVGFPIMTAGLLYGLLTTVDRWVIVSFLGIEQVGYYSLAITVMGFLTLVPGVISQQVYPRMVETFGKTTSHHILRKWVYRQIAMALGITIPLVVGVYLIFPVIVHRFLPAFVPGISAMKIFLIGLFFLPLAGGFGNFLNTVDKQVYYLTVQGLAIPVNLILCIAFVKMGLGINGVALGTTITYAVYGLALLVVGDMVIKRAPRQII